MADRLTITAVVLITFLATWVILVAMIPSGFLLSAQAYTPYDYPDYFTQQDIETIKYFVNHTLTYPDYGTEYDFDAVGASGTYVKVEWLTIYGEQYFRFWHETYRMWFLKWYEPMSYRYEGTIEDYLTHTLVLAHWDADINASKISPITCPTLSVTAWFTDPNATRNNLTQALNDGEIILGIGFGIDDWQAKYNSWTLIGKLLTFQAPEIDPLINGLIATPFWVATVLCIILIIVKFIPFTS